MIQRRVKCTGFKALSRVRRRLLQSIRTRDVLLTLPDRVVYIHQRFFNIHRPRRVNEWASERDVRDALFLAFSRYTMKFLYRQRRGSLQLAICARAPLLNDNPQRRSCHFKWAKCMPCVPKRCVQSIRLHSLSSSVSVRFDGVCYLWHMHYGLLTFVETCVPASFSPERTKKVIALSYVEHAFKCRSVTDRRHTSSYDEMYFRGWEDREWDVHALRSFPWTGFQLARIPEYQCLNIDSRRWRWISHSGFEKVHGFVANLSTSFDKIIGNWGELKIDYNFELWSI